MGIEPTTNSLEGCDSTTELLPLSQTVVFVRRWPIPVSLLRTTNDQRLTTHSWSR
jgi:hypothetical protein